jgi:hypothetical protein
MASLPAPPCRTCGHDSTDHSALAGCTAKDMNVREWCQCSAYVPPSTVPPTPKAVTFGGASPSGKLSTGSTIPSRKTDPPTSAKATPPPVKAGTQRAKMLAGFAAHGAEGATDEEAATAALVSLSSEFAKRSSELRQAGLVEVLETFDHSPCGGPVTRKGAAGHDRIVSVITDQGREVLASLGQPTPPKPEKRRQITLAVAEMEALVRLTNLASRYADTPTAGLDARQADVALVCAALTARDDKPARRGA